MSVKNDIKEPVPVTSTKAPRLVRTYQDRHLLIRELYTCEPPFIVEIKPWAEYAGKTQKALYNIWLSQIAKDTGNTVKALDTYCKRTFLPFRTETIGGINVTMLESITNLKKSEMSTFMAQVQAWAASFFGIELKSNKDNGRD